MHIMVMGLNYRTAPVEVRERFSLPEASLSEELGQVLSSEAVLEAVIVSTCNRTEIYAVVDSVMAAKAYFTHILTRWSGISSEVFFPHVYIHFDEEACLHLFRVSSGLDSMVLGETQILGQVRDAFLYAQEQKATGSIFNQLFKRAITVAKRAHTETEIGKHAVSVSYAAVELAKKIFEELSDKTVLIIGAGKMSELTAKHLYSTGVKRVWVVNRTYEHAKELAELFHGRALDIHSLDLALREADIVISSTGSKEYVVDREQVAVAMKQRRKRPLFMIDIAVPRDLDPAINKLDNVFLYDIDDLQGVVAANLEERAKEAEKISVLLQEEQLAFQLWLNTQEAVPLISALRKRAMEIQTDTMQNLTNKMTDLSERDRHLLQKHTMSMINQLLHEPIAQLKEMATEPEAELYLETFSRMFGINKESNHSSGFTREHESSAEELNKVHQEQAATISRKSLSKNVSHVDSTLAGSMIR